MTYPIIKTDNYILITSDEEIKEDDYYICWDNCYDPARYSIYVKSTGENGENAKKIIAHLPLNNTPILEGVPLLPLLPNEDIDLAAQEYPFLFIEGYKKSKEKYKFTEDDIIKAIATGYDWCHQKYIPDHRMIDNFIQSLSQPKLPVGFKCEMELNPVNHAAGLKLTGNLIMDIAITQNYTPKITNGVMQGEWIFE